MHSAETPLHPLPDLRIVHVGGADAAAFLQAQLSRRIAASPDGPATVAGWHDARGRVRCVFRVLPVDDGFLLEVPADLAEALLAALRLYVLRAAVQMELTALRCLGVVSSGPTDAGREPIELPGLPPLPSVPGARAAADGVTVVCVAPGCSHVIVATHTTVTVGAGDGAPIVAAEIRAGLPQVDQRTSLRYVAQMLNLDRLGALDFDKGCYPGQEVIARTQHLGAVKRRVCGFAWQVPSCPPSDTPIVDGRGTRIGEVLRAAAEADGGVALAVVALDALGQPLFLGTPDGPALQRFALPYEPADARGAQDGAQDSGRS